MHKYAWSLNSHRMSCCLKIGVSIIKSKCKSTYVLIHVVTIPKPIIKTLDQHQGSQIMIVRPMNVCMYLLVKW